MFFLYINRLSILHFTCEVSYCVVSPLKLRNLQNELT